MEGLIEHLHLFSEKAVMLVSVSRLHGRRLGVPAALEEQGANYSLVRIGADWTFSASGTRKKNCLSNSNNIN